MRPFHSSQEDAPVPMCVPAPSMPPKMMGGSPLALCQAIVDPGCAAIRPPHGNLMSAPACTDLTGVVDCRSGNLQRAYTRSDTLESLAALEGMIGTFRDVKGRQRYGGGWGCATHP
jgi:hypothetical protein